MKKKSRSSRPYRETAFRLGVGATVAIGGWSTGAQAFDIPAGDDWSMRLDNTLTYNIGFRADSMDSRIANNPVLDESDYKFPDQGDIVDNSISLRSEFNAVYRGNFGFRASGSGWYNFAYDDDVEANPGEIAPGLSYADTISYASGEYSSYTKRFYMRGAQLLDAFVFANFDLAGHRTSVKLGRQNENWGNALFFNAQGISYSQSYLDLQKAFANPGTQVKDLFLPRAQLSVKTSLTPKVSLAAQYFLEFKSDRLPEGGTYLGFADMIFSGPDRLFAGAVDPITGEPGFIDRGDSIKPKNLHDNFGLRMTWSPDWIRGNLGAYFRRFDETQPWAALIGSDEDGNLNYHQAYPTNVKLYGLSLDTQVGAYSTGIELSYRQNTGLISSGQAPTAEDMQGAKGATGDTFNAIVNAVGILTTTPLYDTGTLVGEIAYTRRVKVRDNEEFFQGLGYGGCPTNYKWDNCATKDYVALAVQFNPQWLQVLPGIDIDLPITEQYGLYGNGAGLNEGFQGSHIYSAGLRGTYQQRYSLKLSYNGYYWRPSGRRNQTEAGEYYAGGNGYYWYNDRNFVSLTFQTTF